jgi:hypothetical protein
VASFLQVFPAVPVCTSPLHWMQHMPCSFYPPLVDDLNNILWGVQILKFKLWNLVHPLRSMHFPVFSP